MLFQMAFLSEKGRNRKKRIFGLSTLIFTLDTHNKNLSAFTLEVIYRYIRSLAVMQDNIFTDCYLILGQVSKPHSAW